MRLSTRGSAVLLPLLASVAVSAPVAAQTIGAYTAPKVWPERPRRFDLIHQRIAISIDWSHRQVNGDVQTTIVATAPADTVRLDAANITFESATAANGRKLKFTTDSTRVTVKLAKKFAAGDTVTFSLKYNAIP